MRTFWNILRYGHQGIEKTRLRVRESVFWPNINKDIEQRTKSCPICQEHQPAQSPETLLPHAVPNHPWEVIGTDLFHLDGNEYLLVADYYSKFFVVKKLGTDATSNNVIRALKQIFSEHGVSTKLMSDNGTQYTSEAFIKFAKDWSFDHSTSSPRYSKSNGFIERHVQTIKAALITAKQVRTDPDLALLCLRTTPLSSNLPSPLEILTGRKARSNLPAKLTTSELDHRTREELQQRRGKQKIYYDRHAKDLQPLQPGQQARIQDHQTGQWVPATVTQKSDQPRSYIVTTNTGQRLRRNRIHFRDIPQVPAEDTHPEPAQAATAPSDSNPGCQPSQQRDPEDSTPPATPGAMKTKSGRTIKAPQKLNL